MRALSLSVIDHRISFGLYSDLPFARTTSSKVAFFLVIITVWVAARILFSNIVVGGSKDSDCKKGVDGLKLLLKFWRIASMLYDSIYWMACSNLIVKSRIDFSSCLRIVCKVLMFIFYLTEQRYYDTNSLHSSLNESIKLRRSLWN